MIKKRRELFPREKKTHGPYREGKGVTPPGAKDQRMKTIVRLRNATRGKKAQREKKRTSASQKEESTGISPTRKKKNALEKKG